MTPGLRTGTRVPLPPAVGVPLEVYVNGVEQREGADYRLDEGVLVFSRELRQEGRLGFWRWASIVLGVAGTYRQNDVVDVIYQTADGRRASAAALALEEA